MRGKDQVYWISVAGGSLVLLFLLYPLLYAFWVTDPALLVQTWRDSEFIASLLTSFWTAGAATAAATLTGVPFAYLLARRSFRGKRLLEGLLDLPVVIPHTVAGIILLMAVSPHARLGGWLQRAGFDFVETHAGIAIAMLFVSFPLLINAARDAFLRVPVRLEFVARTLGAGSLAVFFTITLPLAWRGILTGMVLTWARAVSEFGAVVILAYHPMTAPVLIYERFESYGLAYARPAAVLLLAVSLLVFVVVRLIAGGDDSRAGS
ncbi:MAG: ABC transporter permease [Clostridia bacterium]|nr:ABC transporter permease [Clostridia bacterium]MDH7573837.1 ABC transporter permease [Clostridia bacterium]